ncbi:MAG: GNAT family N-acetyltransferase [Dehalococcoidia bacterium]|nr:GNAT family N-acetyltransferase [Dehalococcoidia bacterium]
MAKPDMDANYWQGELVRLRALAVEDAAAWLAEDADSEAIRGLNFGMELPKSAAMAEEWAATFANFGKAEEFIFFSIETLAGDYVGNINIHGMDRRNGVFETGTRIFRPYRGRGYALEAKRMVLRYTFHELRFQKYNLRCLETNDAIIRHAKRLGCREEGRIRRAAYTEGRYLDILLFGLTREEFDTTEG